MFVDPDLQMTVELYSRLSELGFRRSGQHLYRPQCKSCQACIPARIPVTEFTPNRRLKRCLKRNSDVVSQLVDSISGDEYYQLYERYITERHADGDMYPPSREQYDSFLTAEWNATRFIEFRVDGRLIGVAVTDQMDNGLSAVYTFFDPDESHRSLGVMAVLSQIQWAQDLGLGSVYLGYWIKECQKMAYKIDYRPLDILLEGRWVRVN